MADYGLIGGLAEGLKEGLRSYKDTQREESEKQRRAEEEALKKKMFDVGLLKEGIVETAGGFDLSPEEKAQREHKAKELEPYDPKTNNELAIEAKSTQDMLKRKNPQWASFIQPGMTRGEIKDIRNKVLSGEFQIEAAGARRTAMDDMIKGLQAQKLKKELEQGPKGRELPAGQAESIAQAKSAMKALEQAEQIVKSTEEISGPVAGRVSGLLGAVGIGETGKRAAETEAQLKSRAQIIGKYLEGGKLTDEDIKRYMEIIPKMTDKPEVARAKIENLKTLLSNKYAADIESFQGSGFDVAGLPSPKEFSKKKQKGLMPESSTGLLDQAFAAPTGAPKVGTIEDGYRYNGKFAPNDPKAWDKVK